MFHVFYLRPDVHDKILTGALLRSGAYFSGILLVAAWLWFFEHDTFVHKKFLILALCGFFALVSIMVGVRHYKSGRNFRLFSNEEGFEFTSPGAEVKISYRDITRVVRTPQNTLLIYTNSSVSKPVMMISDKITDRDVFEQILTRFVPIAEGNGLPLLYSAGVQIAIAGLFILSVLLHLISADAATVVVSGSAVIGLLIYTAVMMYIFQKEVKNVRALIALALLIAVVVLRIVLFLLSASSH